MLVGRNHDKIPAANDDASNFYGTRQPGKHPTQGAHITQTVNVSRLQEGNAHKAERQEEHTVVDVGQRYRSTVNKELIAEQQTSGHDGGQPRITHVSDTKDEQTAQSPDHR